MRVGLGTDRHRFESGRKLVLGGVEIPHDKGLAGHSDADALLHALSDALLGSVSLGDIGSHFPDTDPRWKGMDSVKILEHCLSIIRSKGYQLCNCDLVITTEKPKIAPHRDRIIANLARLLGVPSDRVGLKAKTGEGVGAVGEGLCLETQAIVLLERT